MNVQYQDEMSTCHSTYAGSTMGSVEDYDPHPRYPPMSSPFGQGASLPQDILDSCVKRAQDHFMKRYYIQSEQEWRNVMYHASVLTPAGVFFEAYIKIAYCIHIGGVARRREFDTWWDPTRMPYLFMMNYDCSSKAKVSNMHANLLHEQGRSQDEEAVRRKTFDLLSNGLGKHHVATLDAQDRLWTFFYTNNKFEAAEEIIRPYLAHIDSTFAPNDNVILRTKIALAECLMLKDIPALREAEKLWEEVSSVALFNPKTWRIAQAGLRKCKSKAARGNND